MKDPTDEEKALPPIGDGLKFRAFMHNEPAGGILRANSFIRQMTESDLAALLAALSPDVLARVLEPYHLMVANRVRAALGMHYPEEPLLDACENVSADLTAARAEVERLKTFLRTRVPTTRASPHEPFMVCLGCGAADGEDCAKLCWVYELEGLAEPDPKEPT